MNPPALVSVDWNEAEPTPTGELIHHALLKYCSRPVSVGEMVILYEGDSSYIDVVGIAEVLSVGDKLVKLLEIR